MLMAALAQLARPLALAPALTMANQSAGDVHIQPVTPVALQTEMGHHCQLSPAPGTVQGSSRWGAVLRQVPGSPFRDSPRRRGWYRATKHGQCEPCESPPSQGPKRGCSRLAGIVLRSKAPGKGHRCLPHSRSWRPLAEGRDPPRIAELNRPDDPWFATQSDGAGPLARPA